MLFFKYVEEIQPGVNYGVTGALTHPSVRVQEQNGLDDPFMDGVLDPNAMTDSINTVGWDWKNYAGGTFTVLDDRCYFIETVTGSQWRLVFTGFGGSATGNVELGKLLVAASEVTESPTTAQNSHLFPNPATSGTDVNLTCESSMSQITVWSINGQRVEDIVARGQFITLSTAGMKPGMYVVEVQSFLGREVIRLTVQ